MKSYTLHRIFLGLTLLADVLVLCGSFRLAWWVRFESGWIAFTPPAPPIGPYLAGLPYTLLAWLLAMNYAGLYQRRSFVVGRSDLGGIVRAAAAATLIIFAGGFLYRGFSYSRLILTILTGQNVVALRLVRELLGRVQVRLRRRGIGVVRVAILGDGVEARTVADTLRQHPDYGFRLAGFVAPAGAGVRPRLGRPDRLEAALRGARVDEVIVAPRPAVARSAVMEWARRCARMGVECKVFADLFGHATSRLAVEERFGLPMLALRPLPLASWRGRLVKRAFDLALVVPALLLLSPLLLLIAVLVKLESPGPAFYRQERIGLDGRPFAMFKFRSMRADAERETGPVWARRHDPRRTGLGAFLRRTSLDELPQLLNMLKGEMSVVGPRPERPHFVEAFRRRVPRYMDRHAMPPGLTGWAQVNGWRGNTSIEERTKYDLHYVEHWSVWLDVRIVFRTAMEVFHHREAY